MKGKLFLLTALFVLFTVPTVRAEVMEYLGTSASIKAELVTNWKQRVGPDAWKQICATEAVGPDKSHYDIVPSDPAKDDGANAGCSDAMPAFTNDLLDLSGKTKLGYLVDIPVVNIPEGEKKGCEGYDNKKDCPQFEHFRFVAVSVPPQRSPAASSVPIAPAQPQPAAPATPVNPAPAGPSQVEQFSRKCSPEELKMVQAKAAQLATGTYTMSLTLPDGSWLYYDGSISDVIHCSITLKGSQVVAPAQPQTAAPAANPPSVPTPSPSETAASAPPDLTPSSPKPIDPVVDATPSEKWENAYNYMCRHPKFDDVISRMNADKGSTVMVYMLADGRKILAFSTSSGRVTVLDEMEVGDNIFSIVPFGFTSLDFTSCSDQKKLEKLEADADKFATTKEVSACVSFQEWKENDLGVDLGSEKEKAKVCGQISAVQKDGKKSASAVILCVKRSHKDWKNIRVSLCSLEDITSKSSAAKTFVELKGIVCK